jgi:hypothetical protein
MSSNNMEGRLVPNLFSRLRLQRGMAFGVIIITALFAFEIFNYSTTDFALTDLLGDLQFLAVRWATILSIAFCGIDFAGIARLFTPEKGSKEPNEVWYLFGAWLLAATMNAMLTWWGVSLAILGHQTLGNAVIERATLVRVVPIFVAVLVWLIRVLIIGTFSVAGDRLFSLDERQPRAGMRSYQRIPASPQHGVSSLPVRSLSNRPQGQRTSATNGASFQPAPKPSSQPETGFGRPEPTYHSASLSPSAGGEPSPIRSPQGRSSALRR